MIFNCKDASIEQDFEKAISMVSSEGSVEVTFPMNNLGLFMLYNARITDSINIFFDMLTFCIYPYDYFCAYNNLAISFAALNHIDTALDYSQKAFDIVNSGELQDPVFEIKAKFNYSLLTKLAGDASLWDEMKRTPIPEEFLPKRYKNLYRKKLEFVQSCDSYEIITKQVGANMEIARAFGPQNLQFWDFMYPVITKTNFEEFTKLDSCSF
jgi:hypothetical protein